MNTPKPKVALTGSAQTELLAPYFRAAGCIVAEPDAPLDVFRPDYVYDVTSHDDILGAEVPGFRDARLEKLAGCPYSLDGIRAIVDEFAWERLRAPRKALAVDADNTLWKGILSEDGPDALVPHADFQAGLRQLADDGVILILLSKNDAIPLVETPYFQIPDSFAAGKVNWEPKAGNLIEACRELNIATDSVVFVDDNPYERAQMAAHLPDVAIAPFPTDMMQPRQFLRRLREYFFAEIGTTPEDRLRARDYRANALREQYLGKDEYLDALALTVTPALATDADLDRLVQMAGKTNQFNATTRRLGREAFVAFMNDPNTDVWTFRARDRFGEQGIVCYVVLDIAAGRITDFVMSCRAMGRTLEHFAYGFICEKLGRTPVIDFAPTAKNRPFADFLARLPNPGPTHYRIDSALA